MKYLIILFFSLAYSEVTNDSLSVLIREEVAKILAEVTYIDPLKGKIGGLEINPLHTLINSIDGGVGFAGTVSIFPEGKKEEIAFPFAFLDDEAAGPPRANFRLDAQYRYFLGKHRKGIYFMGGARFANKQDYNDFGISFGAGYRIFSKSGFYWGTSFYVGKYITSESDLIPLFMNFEFFKLGMTF